MEKAVCLRCDYPLNEEEGDICDLCIEEETYWEPDGYDYGEDGDEK